MTTLEKSGFLGPEIVEWIAKIRARYPALFLLSEDVNRLGLEVLLSIKPHNRDLQELLAPGLYLRASNSYQSVIILAERGLTSQAAIVTRSLLENLFILVAVLKDRKYAVEYVSIDSLKRREALKKFRRSDTNELISRGDLERIENEVECQIKELDAKALRVKDWAEKADMMPYYDIVYCLLSDPVHINPRNLQRHMDIDANGEVSTIHYGPEIEDIEMILMTNIDLMIRSIESISNFFKKDNNQAMGTLKKRHEVLGKAQEGIDKI